MEKTQITWGKVVICDLCENTDKALMIVPLFQSPKNYALYAFQRHTFMKIML